MLAVSLSQSFSFCLFLWELFGLLCTVLVCVSRSHWRLSWSSLLVHSLGMFSWSSLVVYSVQLQPVLQNSSNLQGRRWFGAEWTCSLQGLLMGWRCWSLTLYFHLFKICIFPYEKNTFYYINKCYYFVSFTDFWHYSNWTWLFFYVFLSPVKTCGMQSSVSFGGELSYRVLIFFFIFGIGYLFFRICEKCLT